MQYTAAGTFTLGGFTPATSYNCSIFAIISGGSGPVAYIIVTTLDDSECHLQLVGHADVYSRCVHIIYLLYFLAMLFQLQLSGTGLRDCHAWVVSTIS